MAAAVVVVVMMRGGEGSAGCHRGSTSGTYEGCATRRGGGHMTGHVPGPNPAARHLGRGMDG